MLCRDMFALLNVFKRFAPRYEAMRVAQRQARLASTQGKGAGSERGRNGKAGRSSKRQASALEDNDDLEEQEEENTEQEAEQEERIAASAGASAVRMPLAALSPNVLAGQAAGSPNQQQQDAAAAIEQVLLSKQQRLLRVRRKMLGRRKHTAASSFSPSAGLKGEDELTEEDAADQCTGQQQVGQTAGYMNGQGEGTKAAGASDSGGSTVPAVQDRRSSITTMDGQSSTVQLPRRLMDQLLPKSRTALMSRVQQELAARGGFLPLMHLFGKSHGSHDEGASPSGSPPSRAGESNSSSPSGSKSVLVLGRRRKTAVAASEAAAAVAAVHASTSVVGVRQGASNSMDVEMVETGPMAPAAAVDKQLSDALVNVSFPWSDLDLECQVLCAAVMRQ